MTLSTTGTGRRPCRPARGHGWEPSRLPRSSGQSAGPCRLVHARKRARFDAPYVPGIVGYMNDYMKGRLTIQLRDRDVELSEGELVRRPARRRALPARADDEAHVLLIEPRGTLNTGDAGGARAAPEVEI